MKTIGVLTENDVVQFLDELKKTNSRHVRTLTYYVAILAFLTLIGRYTRDGEQSPFFLVNTLNHLQHNIFSNRMRCNPPVAASIDFFY